MLWGFRGRSTAPGPDSSALAVLAHRWATGAWLLASPPLWCQEAREPAGWARDQRIQMRLR
jgi:hypothetical protein